MCDFHKTKGSRDLFSEVSALVSLAHPLFLIIFSNHISKTDLRVPFDYIVGITHLVPILGEVGTEIALERIRGSLSGTDVPFRVILSVIEPDQKKHISCPNTGQQTLSGHS